MFAKSLIHFLIIFSLLPHIRIIIFVLLIKFTRRFFNCRVVNYDFFSICISKFLHFHHYRVFFITLFHYFAYSVHFSSFFLSLSRGNLLLHFSPCLNFYLLSPITFSVLPIIFLFLNLSLPTVSFKFLFFSYCFWFIFFTPIIFIWQLDVKYHTNRLVSSEKALT